LCLHPGMDVYPKISRQFAVGSWQQADREIRTELKVLRTE